MIFMFALNSGQEFIVNKAVDWFYNSNDLVFQYDGPPGSGKSVVLNEIVKRLRLDIITEIAPMSFIGAASLVMRTKGLITAKTAHSWIYEVIEIPKKDPDGNILRDPLYGTILTTVKFRPRKSLPKSIKLIVIDEAYCMPANMRPEIEKFGVKILACGDQNQLPPVMDKPAFLADGKVYHLTEIMRQQGLEDIVFIAHRAMLQLPLLNGYYGNSMVIDYEDITDGMLLWADVVICCKNATRDYFNDRIRKLKGFYGDLPNRGERIVCRSNNWLEEAPDINGNSVNLVNGLIGTVINSPDVAGYNKKTRTFEVIFEPDLTQGVVFNTVGNYDYITSPYDMRNQIKENRYTQGNLFEYAYAITCHVSQGSQFHRVIYIEERMKGDIQSSLNLVGPTRADQQLIYVKPEPFDWRKYNQEKQERAAKIEEQKKLMANTASEYKKQQQIKSKYKNIIYKGN